MSYDVGKLKFYAKVLKKWHIGNIIGVLFGMFVLFHAVRDTKAALGTMSECRNSRFFGEIVSRVK